MYESGRRINSYGGLLDDSAEQPVYEDDFIPEDVQAQFEFLDAHDGTVYDVYHDADAETRAQ